MRSMYRVSSRKGNVWFVILVLFVLYVYGTGGLGGTANPKLEVTHRGAYFDKSLVIKLRNIDSLPLTNIRIDSERRPQKQRVAERIEKASSIEVGWMEVKDGFQPGDVVRIYSDEYPLPFLYIVPQKP